MSQAQNDARFNFRLNSELKQTIVDAAAQTGQAVNDFAIFTLAQAARKILQDQQTAKLSKRDSELFAELLDNETSESNADLRQAA